MIGFLVANIYIQSKSNIAIADQFSPESPEDGRSGADTLRRSASLAFAGFPVKKHD